jgi:hypothetical protein
MDSPSITERQAIELLRRYTDLSDPDGAPRDHEYGECLDCSAPSRQVRDERHPYGGFIIRYADHSPGCFWKSVFDFLTSIEGTPQ